MIKYMIVHTYHDEKGFVDCKVYQSDIPDIKEAEKARHYYIAEDEISPEALTVVAYKE